MAHFVRPTEDFKRESDVPTSGQREQPRDTRPAQFQGRNFPYRSYVLDAKAEKGREDKEPGRMWTVAKAVPATV